MIKINAMNAHERFMAKVKVNEGDNCWEWKGCKTGSGYGQFWEGKRLIPAHWFLLNVRPKNGMQACHKCDNRLCVRPSHIFLGTQSDNMKDMVSKGRHNSVPGCRAMLKVRRLQIGEENHESKLIESDVAMIRAVGKGYGRGVKLAKLFNVSETVISGIWKGTRWAHVKPDAAAKERADAFILATGRAEL
jgi:hypothetical protein